jgi:hypothetical protein
MKCFTCHTEMVCVDDVNETFDRIDWFECPNCESWSEVIYNISDNSIRHVTWHKEKRDW